MPQHTTGIIRADEAYSKAIVMERLGISQKFWDKMLEREGASPTRRSATHRLGDGKDLIEYLSRKSATKQANPPCYDGEVPPTHGENPNA